MKITKLTKYGNSMGVRIPKAMLEESGLTGEVTIEARQGKIIIGAPKLLRNGWDEAFSRMARANDDRPVLQDDVSTEWDETDWQW